MCARVLHVSLHMQRRTNNNNCKQNPNVPSPMRLIFSKRSSKHFVKGYLFYFILFYFLFIIKILIYCISNFSNFFLWGKVMMIIIIACIYYDWLGERGWDRREEVVTYFYVICVCTCVCLFVCLCVCEIIWLYIYIYTYSTYIYIYIFIDV